MKRVVCLLPGLTDRHLDDLGGQTPLQKAATPYLDSLAAEGDLMRCQPPAQGGFATAFLDLLGYRSSEPAALGPIQAASLGFRLSPGQVAYGVRLVSIGDEAIVDVSDHLATDNETKELFRSLNAAFGKQGLHWLHLKGPTGVLVTQREELQSSPRFLGLNPVEVLNRPWYESGAPCPDWMRDWMQLLSQHEVNALREDLEERPVNGMLLFEGGTRPAWAEPSTMPLGGLAFLGETSELIGVVRSLGMTYKVLPKEARRFERIPQILDQVKALVNEHDGVILELPYLWQATYEGSLSRKIKGLEWIDANVIRPLAELAAEQQALLAVSSLKHVDITSGRVEPGAVPGLVYWGPEKRAKQDLTFDEQAMHEYPSRPMAELLYPVSVAPIVAP